MQDLTCSAHEVIIFEFANNLLFRDVKNGKNMQNLIAALLFLSIIISHKLFSSINCLDKRKFRPQSLHERA